MENVASDTARSIVERFNSLSLNPDHTITKITKLPDAQAAYKCVTKHVWRLVMKDYTPDAVVEQYIMMEAHRLMTYVCRGPYHSEKYLKRLMSYEGVDKSISNVRKAAINFKSEIYQNRLANGLPDPLPTPILILDPTPRDKNGKSEEDYMVMLRYYGAETEGQAKVLLKGDGASPAWVKKVSQLFRPPRPERKPMEPLKPDRPFK